MKDEEFVDAQREIYSQLGTALLAMLGGHGSDWAEISLHAERIGMGIPFKFAYRVTLTLRDGLRLPLVATPELVEIVDHLDGVCRARSPKLWNSFDYRFYQEPDGPSFESRFSYPDPVQ